MSIPLRSNGNDIDAEWLTQVLEQSGVAAGAEVVAVERSAVGTGQMGENVRFELTWSQAGDRPSTIVGKFPSDDETSRATGMMTGAYEKEVRFYQHVANTVDIRTPRCFHADVQPETGDFVLVLEDLAPRQQGNQLEGCSVSDAEKAMDQLVALQAPRWNDDSLLDHVWLGRRDPDDPEASGGAAGIYTMVLDGFVSQIGPLLDQRHIDVATDLSLRVDEYLNVSTTPRVVVHGDYRLDNMLFDDTGSVDGDGLAVVDWQSPAYGAPAHDLAYFVGTTFDADARRACEDALVRRYHHGLANRGIEWSWEDCWSAFGRSAPAGLVMAVVASQIVVATDRGNHMFAAMASRSADMMLDHSSFDLF